MVLCSAYTGHMAEILAPPNPATRLELIRSPWIEELGDVAEVLTQSRIPFYASNTAPVFSVLRLVLAEGDSFDYVIEVPLGEYEKARSALEAAYKLQSLPDDHFLNSASDDDLAEILGKTEEWSAFDVAHARVLAEERALPAQIVAEKAEEKRALLRRGKSVPRIPVLVAVVGGVSFVFLFGTIDLWLACLLVGHSLSRMTVIVPSGQFHAFNPRARLLGDLLMVLAGFCFVLRLMMPMLLGYYFGD